MLEFASRLQRESSEAERKIDNLRSDKNALERQAAAADERVAQLKRESETTRQQLAKTQSDLAAFQATEKRTRLHEEELTEKNNQLRLAVVTERQRHENLVAQREPMSARDAELVELITVRNGDIAMYETKLARQAQETRESELLITDHAAQRKQAEAGAAKIVEQRATQFAAISHAEADLRHLRDSLGELQDRRAQRQVRESQLQMKIDHLADHVSRSYHVDLLAFVVDESAFGRAVRTQAKKWIDQSAGDDTNGSEAASSLPSRSENTIQLSDNEIEKPRHDEDQDARDQGHDGRNVRGGDDHCNVSGVWGNRVEGAELSLHSSGIGDAFASGGVPQASQELREIAACAAITFRNKCRARGIGPPHIPLQAS